MYRAGTLPSELQYLINNDKLYQDSNAPEVYL